MGEGIGEVELGGRAVEGGKRKEKEEKVDGKGEKKREEKVK